MKAAIAVLAYLVYVTLGTYAIPEIRMGAGAGAVPYPVPLAAGLAAFGLFNFALRQRRWLAAQRSLAKWTLAYIFATLTSLLVAVQVDMLVTTKCLLMASFPLVAGLAGLGTAQCKRCIVLLGFSSLAVLIYGVYGYVTGSVGDPTQHRFGYVGVTYAESTRNGDSLYFQTLLWIALGAAVWCRTRVWLRVILYATASGTALVVILTLVRGAWIAVALSGLIMHALVRKSLSSARSTVLVAAGQCVAVLLTIYFLTDSMTDLVRQRVQSMTAMSRERGNSNDARLVIASSSLQIISEHPVFGVGFANLRFFLPERAGLNINHAENAYLQAFAEQGVVALISFVGLLMWTIKGLLRATSVDEKRSAWAAMVLLALVIDFAIFAVFNNVLDNMWFWSIMALAAMYVSAAGPHRRFADARRYPVRSRFALRSRCAIVSAPVAHGLASHDNKASV